MADPIGRPWQPPRATVLVVDDDAEIRNVLRLYLERDGHRAIEAADGHAALERARSEPVDLILLDVMLPGIGSTARGAGRPAVPGSAWRSCGRS